MDKLHEQAQKQVEEEKQKEKTRNFHTWVWILALLAVIGLVIYKVWPTSNNFGSVVTGNVYTMELTGKSGSSTSAIAFGDAGTTDHGVIILSGSNASKNIKKVTNKELQQAANSGSAFKSTRNEFMIDTGSSSLSFDHIKMNGNNLSGNFVATVIVKTRTGKKQRQQTTGKFALTHIGDVQK